MVVFLLSLASKGANALAEETYSKAGGSAIEGLNFLCSILSLLFFFALFCSVIDC